MAQEVRNRLCSVQSVGCRVGVQAMALAIHDRTAAEVAQCASSVVAAVAAAVEVHGWVRAHVGKGSLRCSLPPVD